MVARILQLYSENNFVLVVMLYCLKRATVNNNCIGIG